MAVVTQPDRPSGRGQRLAATPVKAAAHELGLPVLTPTKLIAFAAEVRELGPERCVVASYGRIVPPALLAAVPLWLNLHPSLLPLYRGATPLQSAIRDGRTTTAVSIIAMDAGLDTGDILAQTEPLAIGVDETYGSLHDRLAHVAAELLDDALDADATGRLLRTPQAQRARELGIRAEEIVQTLTRPWTKDDRLLVPAAAARDARSVVNLVRALAPKPAALLALGPDAQPLGVLRAHVADHRPEGDGLSLQAHDGRWVAIDEVVPPGKRPMSAAAYLNGLRR